MTAINYLDTWHDGGFRFRYLELRNTKMKIAILSDLVLSDEWSEMDQTW